MSVKTESAKKNMDLVSQNLLLSPTTSTESVLFRQMVPSLWGDRLLNKNSLKGRITSYFSKRQTVSETQKKFNSILALSFRRLQENGELKKIPLSIRMKIHSHLSKNELIVWDPIEKKEDFFLSEINKERKKNLKELQEFSFLRDEWKGKKIDAKLFQAIVNLNQETSIEVLSLYQEFLLRHPQQADPFPVVNLSLFDKAWSQNKKLLHQAYGLAGNKKKRKKLLRSEALMMASQVAQLSTNENMLVCGSFGQGIKNFHSLSKLINVYGDKFKDHIPPSLHSLLLDEDAILKDPLLFIQKHLEKFLDEINQKFPKDALGLNQKSLEILFQNSSRELPNIIRSFLPDPLKEHVEGWIQQGLLGNLSEFVEDGSLRELLILIGERGKEIDDPIKRKQITAKIESTLLKILTVPVEKLTEKLLQLLERQAETITSYKGLNPFSDLLRATPILFHFIKQENDLYTLEVYSSDKALNFYSSEGDRFEWPLRLKDIPSKNLSTDFFERIFMHVTEPSYDEKFESKAVDLFEGVLGSLEGTRERGRMRKIPPFLSHNRIAEKILTHPQADETQIRYCFLKENFISFCSLFLQGKEKKLVVDTKENGELLSQGIYQLNQFKHFLSPEEVKSLEATEKEIVVAIKKMEAIESAKKQEERRFRLPLHLILLLKEVIHVETLREARSSLIWALGEEFTPLLDLVIDDLTLYSSLNKKREEEILGEIKSVVPKTQFFDFLQPKKRPNGWLRKLIFSMYWKIGIQAISFAYYIYTKNWKSVAIRAASLIDPYTRSFFTKLSSLLPEIALEKLNKGKRLYQAMHTWYARLQRMLYEFFIMQFFNLGLNFLSKEESAGLKISKNNFQKFYEIRSTLQSWFQKIQGIEKIDFDVSLSLEKEDSIKEKQVYIDPELPKIEKEGLIFKDQHYPFILPLISLQKPIIDHHDFQQLKGHLQSALETAKKFRFLLPAKEVYDTVSSRKILKNQYQLETAFVHLKAFLDSPPPETENSPFKLHALSYLIHQIEQLPLPEQGDVWETLDLEKGEEILHLLSDLGMQLVNAGSDFYNKHPAYYGRFLISMYSLVAIMDKIARNQPENYLDGFSVNICSFLSWIKTNGTYIEDPVLIDRLQKISVYFDPSLDIFDLPEEKELLEKAKKNLFSHPDNEIDYLRHYTNSPDFERKFEEMSSILHFKKKLDKIAFYSKKSFFKDEFEELLQDIPFQRMIQELKERDQKFDKNWNELLENAVYEKALDTFLSTVDFPPQSLHASNFTKALSAYIHAPFFQQQARSLEKFPRFCEALAKLKQAIATGSEEEQRKAIFHLTKGPNCRLEFQKICRSPLFQENLSLLMKGLYFQELYAFIDNPPTSSEETLAIFLRLSDNFSSGLPIPLSYRLLRFQTLLSNRALHQGTLESVVNHREGKSIHIGASLPEDYKSPTFIYREPSKTEVTHSYFNFSPFYSFLNKRPINTYIEAAYTLPKNNPKSFLSSPLQKLVTDVTDFTRKQTQSEILSKRTDELSLPFHQISNPFLFKMICSEESDQIIRLIGYFKNNKQDLRLDTLHFFEWVLFQKLQLRKQLHHAPQTAQLLGDFFTEALDYLLHHQKEEEFFLLALLAVKTRQYCFAYTKSYFSHFPTFYPDFYSLLEGIAWKMPNAEKQLVLLQALVHGEPTEEASEEGIKAILRGLFTFCSEQPSRDHRNLFDLFEIQAWKWKKLIQNWLVREENAQPFFEVVAKAQKLPQNSEEKILFVYNFSVFTTERMLFMKEGLIYRKKEKGNIEKIKQALHSLGSLVETIRPLGEKDYGTANGELTIHLDPESSLLTAQQIVEEKKFTLYSAKKEISYWIEESDSASKKFLVYEKNKPREMIEASFSKGSYVFKTQSKKKIPLAPLPFPGLDRFSKVYYTPLKGMKNQYVIQFENYPFSFKTKKIGSQWKAVDKKHFPGYFIADNQREADLAKYQRYLVLENAEGQKKVLLPYDKNVNSFIGPLVQHMGPFEGIFRSMICNYTDFGDKTGKYCVYDLLDGKLVSKGTESKILLLMHAAVQKEDQHIIQLIEELMELAKRGEIQEDWVIFLEILPLALLKNEKIQSVCLEFLILLEENNALRSTQKETEISPLYSLSLSAFIIKQLIKAQTIQMQDEKKWMLFQILSRELKNVFKFLEGSPLDLHASLKGISWDTVFELLIFSLNLQQSYGEIQQKKEYSKKKKIGMSALKGVQDFLLASSSIPTNMQEILNQIGHGFGSSTSLGDLFGLVWKIKEVLSLQFSEEDKVFLKKSMLSFLPSEEEVKSIKFNQKNTVRYFLYYYHVCKRGSKEQKKELKRLLLLHSGGWDSLTSKCMRYLSAVLDYPLVFPEVEKMQIAIQENRPLLSFQGIGMLLSKETGLSSTEQEKKILKKDPVHHFSKKYPLFDSIFSSLLPLSIHMASSKSLAFKKLFNWSLTSSFSKDSLPPLVTRSLKTIRWMDKGIKTFKKYRKECETTSPVNSTSSLLSYQRVAEEDRQFDAFFHHLFSLAYEEINAPAMTSHPLNLDHGESLKAQEVNESLQAYYEIHAGPSVRYKLRSKEALWSLYSQLHDAWKAHQTQLNEDRKEFLKTINLSAETPLNDDDVLRFFLKRDPASVAAFSFLSSQHLDLMELWIAKDLAVKTRLHQMERALTILQSVLEMNENGSSSHYADLMESVVKELKTRRAYTFDGTIPNRLVRFLLLFEYKEKINLWPRQVERLVDLLVHNQGDAVIELLMSLGKSYFCIPTANAYEADGSQIVVNLWPKEMFETVLRQLSHQSQRLFKQSINALHFDRSRPLDTRELRSFLHLLRRAMEEKESIHMVKEDAQALELLFIDQLYQTVKAKKNDQKMQIMLHKKVLATLREKGVMIADEAHEYYKKEELNYPIGEQKTLDKETYTIIEQCTLLFFKDAERWEKWKNYQSKELWSCYQEKILPEIAEEICLHPLFATGSAEQKQELIDFISGKGLTIPEWIPLKSSYKQICMVRGLLTELYPLVLKTELSVDFGASHSKETKYALPYSGNMHSKESSVIQNPEEAHVKTFFMKMQKGLSFEEMEELIHHLKKGAIKEQKIKGIHFSDTLYGQKLACLCPDLSFARKLTAMDWKKIEEDLARSPLAIALYVRFFIHPTILYWPQNNCSDAQNATSMFKKSYATTGTPYNAGSYPASAKMLYDPGTIGEALHILQEKCPLDGVHLLHHQKAEDVLEEILRSYFHSGSGFTALIDGGAQLKGLSNREVASKMAEYARSHRPDISTIDFFTRDAEGKDVLMTLPVNASTPIYRDLCKKPLEERLTYFDQVHGFGANNPQKSNGKGLLLIGPKHKLYSLLQEVFRMRGVKIFKQFLGEKELSEEEWKKIHLETTQTVHFALTPQVQKMLPENPGLQEILAFALKNEEEKILEDNYEAYQQKVKNTVRRAILDKILQQDSFKGIVGLFKEFMNILIHTVEENPIHLYGKIKKLKKTEKVLKKIRSQSLLPILASRLLSEEEKRQIKNSVKSIPIPPMPKKVEVFSAGKEIQWNALADLNKQLSVNVNQTNENEQQAETENEVQVQSCQDVSRPFYREKEWDQHLNPWSTAWLRFTSPLSPKNQKLTPPLYSAQALCQHHSKQEIRHLNTLFDERLWVSHNFLPIQRGHLVELGSTDQRPLFEILLTLKKQPDGTEKIVSAGCLSQKDAAFWRKQLEGRVNSTKEAGTRVLLYDTSTRCPVGGDKMSFSEIEKMKQSPDFQLLEIQLHFLCGSILDRGSHLKRMKEWVNTVGLEPLHAFLKSLYPQKIPGSIFDPEIIADWFSID